MKFSFNTALRGVGLALGIALELSPIWAGKALAHGGGGDIALFTTDGQADVGFAVLDDDDVTQIEFNPDDSVFQSILLPNPSNPIVPWDFASPEPGYDANEGALPNGAVIQLNTLETSYWDGTDPMAFVAATDVSAGYAPSTHAANPSDGGFHAHPFFGVSGHAGLAANGVYLTKLNVSVDGLADSEPFYMVALVDDAITDSEDAEALGQAVRDYLADPNGTPEPMFGGTSYAFYSDAIGYAESLAQVPEPTCAALAIPGLLIGLLRRRRAA